MSLGVHVEDVMGVIGEPLEVISPLPIRLSSGLTCQAGTASHKKNKIVYNAFLRARVPQNIPCPLMHHPDAAFFTGMKTD